MLRSGTESRAEAGPAEIAAETGPYRVGTQVFFTAIVAGRFGLKKHPAALVEKKAEHLGFLPRADGRFRRRVQRHGVAQRGKIQRENQNALKVSGRVVNGRGKTQHIEGQALQRFVNGHHGIDHFQGLAYVHMAGPLARTDIVKGPGRSVQGHMGRYGDDLAAVAQKKIAVFRRQAHEGHFAIAQAVGAGAESEAARHFLLFHGAGGENQQLVACFHQYLFQRKAHGLGLQFCIAHYCAIDEICETPPGHEKKQRQNSRQQGQAQQ